MWGEQNGVLLHFIPKGSPQSNALIERFNRGFREYNEERPHDSLDDMTPLEYRRQYESRKAEVSTN